MIYVRSPEPQSAELLRTHFAAVEFMVPGCVASLAALGAHLLRWVRLHILLRQCSFADATLDDIAFTTDGRSCSKAFVGSLDTLAALALQALEATVATEIRHDAALLAHCALFIAFHADTIEWILLPRQFDQRVVLLLSRFLCLVRVIAFLT